MPILLTTVPGARFVQRANLLDRATSPIRTVIVKLATPARLKFARARPDSKQLMEFAWVSVFLGQFG